MSTKVLNHILNEEIDLYLRTWNYHWNIEGPLFPSVHKLLNEQYEELADGVDELAERVRALGKVALTDVSAKFNKAIPAVEMLKDLADRHEKMSKMIREEGIPAYEADKDPGTVDLLTITLEKHDKAAWMLRATLK